MSSAADSSFEDRVKAIVFSLLLDPLSMPPAFFDYVNQYNAINPLSIPISQITGFAQFNARAVNQTGNNTSSSSTYSDLGIGATIANLADGKYLFIHGVRAASTANQANSAAVAGLSVNGAAVAAPIAWTQSALPTSIAVAGIATLSNKNSSSITHQFASTGADLCSFRDPWVVVLKYANL